VSASRDDLRSILAIGHDTSLRGEGIALRDALACARYGELRPSFGPGDLLPVLCAEPDLAQQWVMYSKDKRTSAGWYLRESREIGRIDEPTAKLQFATLEEAVAAYVVSELDFWSATGTHSSRVGVRGAGRAH
jgi:hypothetical protein